MFGLKLTRVLSVSLRAGVLLVLAVSLTACGFHLRGNIPLSEGVKNMFVQAPEGTFKEQLEDVLTKSGATIAANKAAADVVLDVTRANSNRTVGTLDQRGKVDSYNLVFTTTYSLKDPGGEIIRKVTTLVESRRYDFDPEQVVASESEEAQLLESMEQDIALRIVRQLSTVTDYQPK